MRKEFCRLAAVAVLALLLAGSAAAADANTTTANQTPAWERTYGGTANETLLSMLGAANGGYLLVGASMGNGTGVEVYLVSTDSNGTAIHEERVPFGPGSPAMADRTLDSGVVVAGGTGDAASLSGDVALLRLAPDGRLLWTRSYSIGSGRDSGDAVRQEADGAYFVAGTTDISTGGSPGLLLLKVGQDGGQIWRQVLTFGASTLIVRDLLAAPDGGYLVIGSTDADHPGSSDILLVKVSSAGTREWERTYAFGAEAAHGESLAASPDGGWLLLGNADGTGTVPGSAVLVKVDTAGNEQWRKRIVAGGSRTWGEALAPAGTGGYAVAGAVAAPEGTRSYAARLDRSGVEVWNRSFAIGNGPSRALAVTAPSQDRLVVGGEASRTPDALYDLYLSSVTPPTGVPNATATATVNVTANLTASATPTANATSTATPGTSVPATTSAAIAPPLCLAAVGCLAVIAALRRR
jgi:hypothetical protein